MRFSIISLFLFSANSLFAQTSSEIREYSGVVVAIEPGRSFNYSRLVLNVNEREEPFVFNPIYGSLFVEKIKIGSKVILKANINNKSRQAYYNSSSDLKVFIRNFLQDAIVEINVGNEVFKLKPLESQFYERVRTQKPKTFLDKKILTFYNEGNFRKGMIFQNGLVAYNKEIDNYYNPCKDFFLGDTVSFTGFKLQGFEGGKYPMEGVKEVYTLAPLNKVYGRLESFLFKQNEVCIGAKFSTKSGNDIKLSFPSDKAEKVKKFLKSDVDLKIYYGLLYNISKLDLPELQAIIQGRDTLYIEEFGFFGGADVKHDHTPIELKGKISRINRTEKGMIIDIIIDGKIYVEIESMMAQQIGSFFRRGKEVIIEGKRRIKKEGEIYKKDYTIVVPSKLVIDGKTFLSNQR